MTLAMLSAIGLAFIALLQGKGEEFLLAMIWLTLLVDLRERRRG